MKKRALYLPLALAVLPVISLGAENIEVVAPRAMIRPAAMLLMAAALTATILYRLTLDKQSSAICASMLLLLFGSYGHFYNLLEGLDLFGDSAKRHILLVILQSIALALALHLALRSEKNRAMLLAVLGIAGASGLILASIRIIAHEAQVKEPWRAGACDLSTGSRSSPANRNERYPDIYYIVLDGYARADTLMDLYGYDNSRFIEFLNEWGFHIASASRSNYGQSSLSIASSLNMEYLDEVGEELGDLSANQRPIARMIRNSEVRCRLEAEGYQTIAFATGYRRTELSDAEVYLEPPVAAINGFESMLISTSMLQAFQFAAASAGVQGIYPGYSNHRGMIDFAFSSLTNLPDTGKPRFVFAHIVSPHPPFVFDSAGEARIAASPFDIRDGNEYSGSPNEYKAGYLNQISYINQRLMSAIDVILSQPEAPIIILQADHGPGAYLNWEQPDRTNLRERMAILNAYFFPWDATDTVYDSISPVNTFRLIFNQLLQAEMGMLPDRSFFSSWRHPYLFIEYVE